MAMSKLNAPDMEGMSYMSCLGLDFGTFISSAVLEGTQVTNPENGTPDFKSSIKLEDAVINYLKRLIGLNPKDAEKELERLAIPLKFAKDGDGNIKTDNNDPETGAALYEVRLRGKEKKCLEVTADFLATVALASVFKTIKCHVGLPVNFCVGCPVAFNEGKKNRLENSLRNLAAFYGIGVKKIILIPEPVLASYAFFEENDLLLQALEGKDPVTVTVVDIGCGTTDCAVVKIYDGKVEILETQGELFGGADVTAALAKLLEAQNQKKLKNDETYLAIAEELKKVIKSTRKQYIVEDILPAYKPFIKCTLLWKHMFSNNGKTGALDFIRTATQQMVTGIAARNASSKLTLLVGGGSNFEPLAKAIENRGGKTQVVSYGISKGGFIYISKFGVPIVKYPVRFAIGTFTIGERNDEKYPAYSEKKGNAVIAIPEGTVVNGRLEKTLVVCTPSSKKSYKLRIPIIEIRRVMTRGNPTSKMEVIGYIIGSVDKGLMKKDLKLVFVMTPDMSLTVDAYINDQKFGSFSKLGTPNVDNEAGTSTNVPSESNFKQNLESFLKSDEDVYNSDSDESDEGSNSGSKRPRDDEGSSPESDEEARQDKLPRVEEVSKNDSVIPANSVIPTDPPKSG